MRLSRLPLYGWLTTTWQAFTAWSNVEIYKYKKLEIRRLDILLLALGVSIALYYYLFYGWQTAVLGTGMYLMVLMCALWLF